MAAADSAGDGAGSGADAVAGAAGGILPAFGEGTGAAGAETEPVPVALAATGCAWDCSGAGSLLNAIVKGEEHSGQLAVNPSSVSSQVSVPWQWGQLMLVALIKEEFWSHSPQTAALLSTALADARRTPLTLAVRSAYIPYAVRLIKPSTLRDWAGHYPDAAQALAVWQRLMEGHDFPHFAALRRVFPHADQIAVASKRTVTVFNVRGNHYRLVAALHYNRQLCFALRFLTHADYSKDQWKNEL